MTFPSPSSLDLAPGIGHNHGSPATDPVTSVRSHLDATYRDLVARFIDLQLGCGRVPDPICDREEAGLVTDFIAQCQTHLKQAEAAHKVEKATFLEGGLSRSPLQDMATSPPLKIRNATLPSFLSRAEFDHLGTRVGRADGSG